MVDTLTGIVEFLKAGGAYAMLVGSFSILYYYHKWREAKELDMREGYRSVIEEKEKNIMELQGKLDRVYESQILGLGDNVERMTEALVNVNNSLQANTSMLSRVENRL